MASILIVDGNTGVPQYIEKVLEKEYTIIVARNGTEALLKIDQQQPLVILCDIGITLKDGTPLLQSLKKNPKTSAIPVILLASLSGNENTIEGYDIGADEYLLKPFSAKELIARVRSQLKIDESNKHYHRMLMESPFGFSVMKGKEMVLTLANDKIKDFWGKGNDVEGKTLLNLLPELANQPFPALLNNVFTTGIPFYANELPARLKRHGKMEDHYFNVVYQPHYEADETISGVATIVYEVTEMVLARKKVEESERRFRNLVEKTPTPICILKGEDMVLDVANEPVYRIWNVGKEALGKPFLEIIPEMKGQPFMGWLLDVFHNGVTHYGNEEPAYFIRENGEKESVYFNFTYQPYHEDDGTISGVMVLATDVTEQVLARKKVEESKHRYQEMVYSSPSMIAILKGEDLIIDIANDAILETWGKGKDVFGKPLLSVMPELIDQGFEDLFHQVYTTGEPNYGYEVPVYVMRNGQRELSYYTFSYQAQRDVNNEIDGVAIIATEVTPQAETNKRIKASEEQFRLLVRQAPVAICVLRGEHYIIEVINEGMCELWGRTSAESLNKPVFDVLTELRSQGFKELLDNVYYTGERFVAEELPISLMRNGSLETVFVKFVYEPLREGDGTISGVMALAHEITEQVLARKKIEESEAFNRSVLENSPDCVKIIDVDGRIQYMNANAISSMEIDNFEPFKNKPWTELWNKENKEVVLEAINTALSGQTAQFQAFRPTSKGTPKWWDVIVSPVLEAGSSTVRNIISVSRDITEQKEAQALLKYRKALLEAHNEASIEGILLVDTKGEIISFNRRFIEIWNMPQQIVDAQDDKAALAFAMTQLINPSQFIEKVEWLYDHSGEISIDELEFKDGKVIERHGYPVKSNEGVFYAWSWTFRDVTEQRNYEKAIRESESHFRLMADLMPAKISNADANGNLFYFNKHWLDYSGMSFEDLKNGGYHQIMHLDELEEFQKRLKKSEETGKDLEMEMRFLNKDGDYKWHLNIASPVKDEHGNLKMWTGVTTEIHKIKEEEQRNGAFLKMVSHELKTPVTSIKGYVQFLLRSLKEDQEKLLHPLPLKSSLLRIDMQIVRLTRLIDEILDLSRLEEGKLELKSTLFSLNHLVNETVEDIRHTNPKHSINVSHQFDCSINGDVDRIGQVIINLITNAIKYSANSDKIELSIRESEGNRVSVNVEDYGIGIDKKDQERIFERFYRVEGKSENIFAGFGIGLFIASEIIKRHNGFLTIESEKGKGSVFTFTLPYVVEKTAENMSI